MIRPPVTIALCLLAGFVIIFGDVAQVRADSADTGIPTLQSIPRSILGPTSPERVLLSDRARRNLGFHTAPDSNVDHWDDGGEESYLVFSGALTKFEGHQRVRGTFRIRVDEKLNRVLAETSEDVSVVLRSGDVDASPGGRTNSYGYDGFDRDYAGGGTTLNCPDSSGRRLYFYHGENHTDPSGRRHTGPTSGWTGIGLAYWDPDTRRLKKEGQIIGMAVSNAWFDAEGLQRTFQGPPISSLPSAVYRAADGYVYVYFTDRTLEPDYSGRPEQCDTRICPAVARARADQLCSNLGAGQLHAFSKYHRGAFDAPALSPSDGSGDLPGTGGRFTPLYSRHQRTGENAPSVTYLASRGEFVMVAVQKPSHAIIARYSIDGLHWSAPHILVEPPPENVKNNYPRILSIPDSQPQSYALLFVRMPRTGHGFRELVRLDVDFRAR